MSDTACNGWEGYGTRASAYATWRVRLELFDDEGWIRDHFPSRPSLSKLAAHLEYEAGEYVDMMLPPYRSALFVRGWLDVFLDDVSWEEIAEHMLLDWPSDNDGSVS